MSDFKVTSTSYLTNNDYPRHPYRRFRNIYGSQIEVCEDHCWVVVDKYGNVRSSVQKPSIKNGKWKISIDVHTPCFPSNLGRVSFEGDWKQSLRKIIKAECQNEVE